MSKQQKETEQTIYGVSEAFSIQPNAWYVGNRYHTQTELKEIRKESIYDTGDPYDFYVGYDLNGKKVFAVRVQAATVLYK